MNFRYAFLSGILIILGVILIFLPEKKYTGELGPESLMTAINDDSRYVTPDMVAHKLIEADPALMLIDVRTPEEFKKFSLPGAINIPLDSVLLPKFEGYLFQENMLVTFYSNGSVYASQAWTLCKRRGCKNVYIMKGGLNAWVETILRPKEPSSTAPSEEFDLYQARLAASQFFGGGSAAVSTSSTAKPKVVKRNRSKKAAQGGC